MRQVFITAIWQNASKYLKEARHMFLNVFNIWKKNIYMHIFEKDVNVDIVNKYL